MSAQSVTAEDLSEVEKYLTVFEGSSREDVSHARQLWSSLSLLPPQESRLVSADIHQRLPVSRRIHTGVTTAAKAESEPPCLVSGREKQRQEERRRYEAMAENRREILELLRKQREQRIQKELLTAAFKPKPKIQEERTEKKRDREERESDREMVQQLE